MKVVPENKQPPNPTKRCPRCKKEKPREDFHKNASRPNGLQTWCKECQKGRDHRTNNLKKRYNMTPDDWDRMLAEQGGGCGICGTTEPGGRGNTFHVDHDHATGKVRGLLCFKCNTDLNKLEGGFFEKATAYLRRHKERRKAA